MLSFSLVLLFMITNKVTGFVVLPQRFDSVPSSRLTLRQSSSDNSGTTSRILEDCVCLVTGASRGIGKGIALELARQGATVYVTGTSSSASQQQSAKQQLPFTTSPDVGGPGTIEETAQQITNLGGKGIPVYCNHAVDDDVKKLFDQIALEQGRLDILVNNVFRLPPGGARQLYKPFWEQGAVVWDTLHTVGLRSHFISTCYAMPLMLKASENRRRHLPRPFIAMISSFGGLTYTFNVPYGVGKAGVDRLVKDMAVELDDKDICVASFWPGIVETERTKMSVDSGDWDKYVSIPLDNAESPEFTGRAVVAVATDPANMSKSGTYQVVAEIAQEYGFTDVNGKQPPSIRSLRFLIPAYALDENMKKLIPEWMIPDFKLPFWVMAQGRPPKPTDK